MPLAVLPVILESDQLSLSTGFELQASGLFDVGTTTSHRLSTQGLGLARLLVRGLSADRLHRRAQKMGVTNDSYWAYLLSLHTVGALQIGSRHWGKRGVVWLKYALLGIRPDLRVHRRPATVRTIAAAVIRSSAWLIVPWLLTLLVFTAAGLQLQGLVAYSGVIYGFIVLSTIAHELAHWWTLRAHTTCFVQWRGVRLRLIHGQTRPAVEVLSSLAGPMIGIICTIGLGLSMQWLLGPALWPCVVTVSLLHAFSWLPSFGDGWSLVNMRKRYG